MKQTHECSDKPTDFRLTEIDQPAFRYVEVKKLVQVELFLVLT